MYVGSMYGMGDSWYKRQLIESEQAGFHAYDQCDQKKIAKYL